MSKIIDDLRSKWDSKVQFEDEMARYLSICFTHPQEWFLGWSTDRQKELVLVTQDSSKLADASSSKFIKVTERKTEQDKYLLCFTLVDESVYEVFLKLCEDLIEQVKEINNVRNAQNIVLERFQLWKRMLERQTLSMESYKGVLGELLLIRDLLHKGHDALEILNGWTGPEFTEQDFVFPASWYEVKAVTSGAMVVTISSAGQLDHPGEGFLCVYHLDKQATESPDALSAKKVADLIKEKYLRYNSEALQLFEEKLFQYEYATMVVEDVFWFSYSHHVMFSIADDFPKLTHDMKRVEMQSVKYTLILSALEKWRIQ